MKLVIAIISNEDAKMVQKNLIKEGFYATKLATTGGFLSSGNTTFLVGCEDELVDKCLEAIKECSVTRNELVPSSVAREFGMANPSSVKVRIGGATVFVVEVEQFFKF